VPVLAPGVAVRSRRPTLLVENDLALGSWLFRLTVVDDNGLESGPADLVVRVVARLPGPIPDPGPVVPGPIIPGPIIPGPVLPRVVVGPGPGGRRTRAPKPGPDTPARPARPARRPPRTRKKPKP